MHIDNGKGFDGPSILVKIDNSFVKIDNSVRPYE